MISDRCENYCLWTQIKEFRNGDKLPAKGYTQHLIIPCNNKFIDGLKSQKNKIPTKL